MKYILSSILALSVSNIAIANSSPKPLRCPDVAAISSAGFDGISDVGGNGWVAIKHDFTYGTDEHWTYAIYVGAATQEEALDKAKHFTQRVHFNKPRHIADTNSWLCDFSEKLPEEGTWYISSAITPPKNIHDRQITL